MKDKQMIVMVDEEFLEKVDYIQRINDYKNKSDTVRKTIEKEFRKEKADEDANAICKGCEHWEKNCSKLIPALRWKNQDRCRNDAEGKYKKYKYGRGYAEDEDGR